MFCKNCGRQLDEGENICPACGTVNATETPAPAAVQYDLGAVDTANDQLKGAMADQAFKWGLMSLIFAATGCLSLLGFIFSFIAKARVRDFELAFGAPEGKANAGRILGKIGFGVGLGYTIFFAFYFLVVFLAILAEAGVM